MDKPFTPETLAERWGCSSRHVRDMIRRGELSAFRLGAKLVRIPADVVAQIEQQGSVRGNKPRQQHSEPLDYPKVVMTFDRKRPPP